MKKKVRPQGSSVSDHSLLCGHSLSFVRLNVLTKENTKCLLELKESILVVREKTSLCRKLDLHHYTYLTE